MRSPTDGFAGCSCWSQTLWKVFISQWVYMCWMVFYKLGKADLWGGSEASTKSWWNAKRCLTRMSQLLPAFLDTSFLSGRGWALDSMNTTALFWDCWQWDSYLLCRGLAGYSYSVHLKGSAVGCYWLLTTGRQCLTFWTASCSNLSMYFGPFC